MHRPAAEQPLDERIGPAAQLDWLAPTRQLDLGHPRLRVTAFKLTQSRQSLAARASAIQDFVRRLPFCAAADGATLRASDVLRRGAGDCHSKGLLFTALCRCAGLPARLLFVDVRTRFLAGLLDEAPPVLSHAVGQVEVDGRWWSTDGYVVDPVLFAHAKHRLREARQDAGWGIVQDASAFWSGHDDCLHQFQHEDVVRPHGVWHDPAGFHASRPGATGWSRRLRWAIGAHLVNRRAARLRQDVVSASFPLSNPSRS